MRHVKISRVFGVVLQRRDARCPSASRVWMMCESQKQSNFTSFFHSRMFTTLNRLFVLFFLLTGRDKCIQPCICTPCPECVPSPPPVLHLHRPLTNPFCSSMRLAPKSILEPFGSHTVFPHTAPFMSLIVTTRTSGRMTSLSVCSSPPLPQSP